jgi:DNA-binding CsgD family transcriptional regulator
MASLAGLNKSVDIAGQTDFDFAWSEGALLFRGNDQKVISKDEALILIEPYVLFDGNEYTKGQLLSYKKPLRTRYKKTIGIFGISILSNMHELSGRQRASNNQLMNHFKISQREHECLYHLAHGRSAKQIAIKLSISHRTVEEYLENAKIKLNCFNRSQLIERVINLGIL